MTPQIIPANPGFFALVALPSGEVARAPIIAWQITGSRVFPILVTGMIDPDKFVIVGPEGNARL